ncbi:MAG: hypothetical protein JOY66_16750 [Acetobacteraceae bacterium]|nr:hypothetical protein [Acetobacteraceae bacterium]
MQHCSQTSDSTAPRRTHLLIAGTGRAGTSFLVRYLTAVGLDTTLSRNGDAAFWDEDANAGLEELPTTGDAALWPYVVKTPWLHQFVDQLLADESIGIEAVIVPVRPLSEAAASRVVLELRALHAAQPWMADCQTPWNAWGSTPGGCLMPLEPLDKARLLAVGFHHLIERLVSKEVPIVFVAFPRLVHDPEYLFAKLAPFLPGVSAEQAREAHARLADPSMPRVGGELRAAAVWPDARVASAEPGLATLNHLALRRELTRVRAELGTAKERASEAAASAAQSGQEAASQAQRNAELLAEAAALRTELGHLRTELAAAAREAGVLQHAADGAEAALERAIARALDQQARADTLAAQVAERDTLLAEGNALLAERDTLLEERDTHLAAMRASTCWRLTGPLRAVATGWRRLARRVAPRRPAWPRNTVEVEIRPG